MIDLGNDAWVKYTPGFLEDHIGGHAQHAVWSDKSMFGAR